MCENLIRFCKEFLININSVRTRVRPGSWTRKWGGAQTRYQRYGIKTQRTAKGLEPADHEKTGGRFSKERGGQQRKRRSGSKNKNIVS